MSMKGGELYTDTTECTLNYNKVTIVDCLTHSHEQRPPSGGMIFKLFKINTSNYLLDFYLIVHFEIVYISQGYLSNCVEILIEVISSLTITRLLI